MLSWNHKDIGDAFSLLIDLNKSLHGLEPADETNMTKICESLSMFLDKLSPMIGDTFLNDRKRLQLDRLEQKRLPKDLFERRSENRKNWQRKPYGTAEIRDDQNTISCSINSSSFNVSIKEIQKIIRSLDMLKADIIANRHCHFKILGIQEDVETNFRNDDQPVQEQEDPEYDKGEYADPGQKRSKISVLKSKGIVVSGGESLFSTNQYQHILVDPLSEWAFIQLSGYFRDSDDDKPEFNQIGTVESLYHRSWRSLWELCTSIIVMFHAAFGDFSRLKICKECGALFYEKRSDRKEFCESLCRVKFNQAGEPCEKRKCRMRQNQWVRNSLAKIKSNKTPYTIGKGECSECSTGKVKGGKCEIILKKNLVALSASTSSPKKK
jgi:hypothetical protein